MEPIPRGWDDKLNKESLELFTATCMEIMQCHGYTYPRALIPLDYKVTTSTPLLLYSADGSQEGLGCTCHLVTEMSDNDPNKTDGKVHTVTLIKASARLLPLKGASIPRSEMDGMVALSNLKQEVESYIKDTCIPIKKHLVVCDSTTVIRQL